MKKLVVLFVLALAVLFATATPAQAGSNHGAVIRHSGGTIAIDCSYDGKKPHADHNLGTGYTNKSTYWCSDTDNFYLRGKACVTLYVFGMPSHLVRADPYHWFRIGGYSVAHVYSRSALNCSKAPWISDYLTRLS